MDEHFATVRLINFDVILDQCRGDELKSPIEHYKLIQERDFINYKMEVNNAAIASTIGSERHDLHIEKNLVEKSVSSDGFCLKKHKN